MSRLALVTLIALAVVAVGTFIVFFDVSEPETDSLEGLAIPFEVQPINM